MTDSVYSPQLGDRPFQLLGADPFAEAPFRSWLKGALLGILATVLVAAPPAWEAASVPARVALSRSGLEGKARRAVGWVGVGSLMLAGVGVGLLAERAAHHPEWFNVYNRVVVDLTTHEAGGITHKDFDLACQIEVIAG